LREQDSPAAAILTKYGLTLDNVREFVATYARQEVTVSEEAHDSAAAARSLASMEIQCIAELVRELEQAQPNTGRASDIVARINEHLMVLGKWIG
jgi:hypothetical protein